MNIMRKRAMAITFSLALLTVAFVGFVAVDADPHLPDDLTVTVTDNYGDTEDMITYAGDDVYFNLTGWGAINGSADYTVEIKINEGTGMEMDYNEMYDYFSYTLMDAPAGTHTWNVTVVNNTDMDEKYLMGSLMVYDMPAFVGADFSFDEDMVYEWNLTAFFTGVATVSIENATELAAEGWTIVDEGMGIYNISQEMNMNGTWEFEVMGSHAYGESVKGMVMVTVSPINDAPVINSVVFDEMQYEPEWVDVMNMLNVTGVEGNFSWVAEIMLDEDQMDVNFTVNATDLETDHANLTYDFDDSITEGIEVNFDADWHQNNVTIDENMYGYFLVNFTVTDDDLVSYVWILFNVTPVNDAPTIELVGVDMGEQLEVIAGVNINKSVTYDDIDDEMENVTIMWYVDGSMVSDMSYFLHNWTTEGLYNVSVMVEDDDGAESEELYFLVNITIPPPTWTADDVVLNYTEAAGDVVMSVASGDLISGYTYGALKLTDMPGMDILGIDTAIDGNNLKITLNLAGTPIESTEIDYTDLENIPTEFEYAVYKIYFVKSDFTEPKMAEATPDMEWEPAEGNYYDVSSGWFGMGYLSYGEILGDEGDPVVDGNSIVWTISLADLEDAGVTVDDFNLFAQATYSSVSTTMEAAYDSAGMSAATHLEPGASSPDDEEGEEDDFPIMIVIIIAVVLLLIIIVVIVVMKKGKKEDEIPEEEPVMGGEEEMPAEGGEMPMEGMEQPMEESYEQPVEQPMEQTYEQPVEQPVEQQMPEQPVEQPVEQQMPEQPVEQPIPPQPEVPAPEPPVAPPEQPVPPMPPQ